MKSLKNHLLLFTITTSQYANAATDLGASSAASWVKMIGMILFPIGFMATGLVFMKNRQEGQERMSGTVMGAFIFCGAGSIFSLIAAFAS